jgi:hypothetical protein
VRRSYTHRWLLPLSLLNRLIIKNGFTIHLFIASVMKG